MMTSYWSTVGISLAEVFFSDFSPCSQLSQSLFLIGHLLVEPPPLLLQGQLLLLKLLLISDTQKPEKHIYMCSLAGQINRIYFISSFLKCPNCILLDQMCEIVINSQFMAKIFIL